MINFFRKTRKKMADDNRPLKYMRYAIGEIVLVVVGILIALSINNWNEIRKEKERFNDLLINVQKELQKNIFIIDRDTPIFMEKDSLLYLVQNKLVTLEMYDENNIWDVGYNRKKTSIQNDAFKNLIGSNYVQNKRQDSIISLLKTIYIGNKIKADKYYDYVGELVSSELLSLSKSKEWYSDLLRGEKLTKEMLNYFLTDPLYFNYLAHFSNYQIRNYVSQIQVIRFNSITAHKLISKYFNKTDTILSYKVDDFKHYIGVYKGSETQVVIESEDDKLYYNYNNLDGELIAKEEIYPVSKTSFTTGFNNGFYYLILDESNHVISHRFSSGVYSEDFKKE